MADQVTSATKTRVFGLHGGRCAYPACGIPVVLQFEDEEDIVQIGEIAHIVPRLDDNSRADANMSMPEKNHPTNLLLLCRNHHVEIDTLTEKFTVEVLKDMRGSHIKYVAQRLDSLSQSMEEARLIEVLRECETIINPYLLQLDVDNLSSHIPSIEAENLYSRVWLGELFLRRAVPEDVEAGRLLRNFIVVYGDLTAVFGRESDLQGKFLRTHQFHKVRRFDQGRYEELSKEYRNHVRLLHDLLLELCRAYNALSENVRSNLIPDYFKGFENLSYETDDISTGGSRITVPAYRASELEEAYIYSGLDSFSTHQRQQRNQFFGDEE